MTISSVALSDQNLLLGRNLRRALDLKLKKLRSLLTADEDITTELDKIVCRLMKLALRSSESHQMPPPATWMQRKFLDLLSLTEKAIQRRRKHFIENYPFKAIEYDRYDNVKSESLTLNMFQNDDTADKIVDRYFMLSSEPANEKNIVKSEVHYTEENLSVTSNEIEQFSIEPKSLFGELRLESIKSESKEEIRLEITQGWIDEDYGSTSNKHINKSNVETSDSNTSNDSKSRIENISKNTGVHNKNQNFNNKMNKFSKKCNKERQSKNKLIKKISKKHSSSGQLPRSYSKRFEFVEYKSCTFNKPKISFKEHHHLQPTLSKPIPRSLIELCYQDLRSEKSDKLIESTLLKDNLNDVAATKDSFVIDIVTEDLQETFALRRSIATDVDQRSDTLESEAALETVIKVTKDDSFDANHVVPYECIDSETIFLNDLNEPSTSKGIRHVNADAQCGPDMIYSISPNISSVMNLPNKCETGIKIGDSFIKLSSDKGSVDFGTTTDGNNFYCDMAMSPAKAIKIKDSDLMLTKTVECSTLTQENDFILDKLIIKPTKNVLNTRQSISALRVCSSNVSGFRCLKNPSDDGMSQIMSVTKYIRPKLSFCGTHVHSYRDRQASEDVVFQGEWQKKGPTILAKKSPSAQPNFRKREIIIRKKKVNSKEKINPLKQKDMLKYSTKECLHKYDLKYTKPIKEIITNNTDKKVIVPSIITKNGRKNLNASKVAMKTVTNGTTCRNVQNTRIANKKCAVKCITNNNYSETRQINKKEEYKIKQTLTSCISYQLNKSPRCAKSLNKTVSPVIRTRTETEALKDKLLKFSEEKRNQIAYLVFRNEIENSKNAITTSANSKTIAKEDRSNNNYTSTSQNSSPCSSPDSIATVRELSVTSKSYCGKNSTTSEKSNLKSVLIENKDHCKNKAYNDSTNGTKAVKQSFVLSEHKENLPQSSKMYETCKGLSKFSKTFVGNRNENVFMFQLRAESPPSISRKSESTAKTRSSSNPKILKNKNTENNQTIISSRSFNKSSNNQCKSVTNCNDDTLYENETRKVPEINNLTRSSTPILDKMSNVDDQGSANEHIYHTKRSNSQISAAMKLLIEERLNFIKRTQPNNDSDSETIILSQDDHERSLDNISPISYKTIVNSDNNCDILSRDIENALLNYSFDSNLESLVTLGTTHSRLPGIDKNFQSRTPIDDADYLSFKSTESITKFPDYLHHSNLEVTQEQQNSNSTKVRGLFERKDQPVPKNAGGVLAVQVFSGFSMDGDPIVGDQPEYTRLVDPETGNLALEMARQATSEELFVSGRSSDTYESCHVEDDAYLPNWLFHIINQQESAETVDEEQEPEPVEPLVEPEFDGNGNIIDAGFGVGVGAGDGHGMHSDQSQDSSGRGTSISSSDVSSGPQSEAILIDPSAFLGPDSRAGHAIASSVVAVESSDTSFRPTESAGVDTNAQRNRDNVQRRLGGRVAVVSDADADVSSLDTDAVDSDN